MFKKLKKLFESVHKSNTMYARLHNLYWYCKLFDLNTNKLQVLDCNMGPDVLNDSITLQFKSNLGTVKIKLTQWWNITFYYYTLDYANYAGSTIFEIKSYPADNEVDPQLGFNLKAEDIDLAIFELQRYLFDVFGDIEEARNKYLVKKEQAKKLHEEELKKLF